MALYQLFIDDAVDRCAVGRLRHQHVEPMLVRQPPLVKILFHRKGSAQQAYALQPGRFDGLGGRVGDVQQLPVPI